LVISVLFGILVATKFTFRNFWEATMVYMGRLRYNHTEGISSDGGNAFLAFFYYVVHVWQIGRFEPKARLVSLWIWNLR